MKNKLYLTIFLLTSFLIQLNANQNKIIYLISPPRSLSVAFLRMMYARGDFKIMHEPCVLPYALIHYKDHTKDWFRKDVPQTFQEVKEKIIQEAETGNLFIKDISCACKDLFLNDIEFIKNTNIQFVFLLRNPHHVILSFYNRIKEIADGFSDLVDYKSCYEIFKEVKKFTVNTPIIIFTEDLYSKPKETVQKFCKAVQIPFIESSLSWENLGEDFEGFKEWHETKFKEHTQHWHGDAIKSTGFGKPAQYKVDENGKPTFSEITNETDKKACGKVYEENLKFYNLFLLENSHFLK